MKQPVINATTIRAMTFSLLAIITGLLIYGFNVTNTWLQELATSAQQSSSLSLINNNVNDTKILQSKIAKVQPIADKADSIAVLNQNFENQVNIDITKYASKTGLGITSIINPKTSPALAPTISPQNNISERGYMIVSLKNPVQLTSLLKFLKLIETNLPKMQIEGINITANKTQNGTVNVEPINIGVYIK